MEEGWEGTKGEAGWWWWKLRVKKVPGWKSYRSLQLKTLWTYREGISRGDLEDNYWPQSFLPSASLRQYQFFNLLSKELSQQCLLGGVSGVRHGDSPWLTLAWLLCWTAKSQRRSLHSPKKPSRSLAQSYQCNVNGHGEGTSLPQAQKNKICEALLPSDCSQIHIQVLQKRKKIKHTHTHTKTNKQTKPN